MTICDADDIHRQSLGVRIAVEEDVDQCIFCISS
jgi:hypothetical protein